MIAGAAHVHRHHRAQAGRGRLLAAVLQQATQPAGRRGEDDVVHRAAERALDLLQLTELDGEHREGALRADRVVQAGVGRRNQLVADDQLCESLRAPEGVPGAGGVGSEADSGLGGLQAGLARTHGRVPEPQCGMGEASDAALQGRGLGFRDGLDLGAGPQPDPAVRAAVDRPLGPLALGVQQDRRQVDGPDPVDHAVVGLGDQSPAAVGEFEDCDLPERLGAIEPLRVILPGPLHELVAAARRMQAGREDVALDPEIAVLLPGGPVQAARPGVGEPLGVARQVGQPGDHVPADLLQRGSPARVWLEDHDPADVHVGALVDLLQLEEGRVEGGELLAHDLPRPRCVEHHPALRRGDQAAGPVDGVDVDRSSTSSRERSSKRRSRAVETSIRGPLWVRLVGSSRLRLPNACFIRARHRSWGCG